MDIFRHKCEIYANSSPKLAPEHSWLERKCFQPNAPHERKVVALSELIEPQTVRGPAIGERMQLEGQQEAARELPVSEWRKGWPVIVAAGMGYGTGGSMILLLAGLFIKPMRDTLGWSTTAVTISPLITLTWALCYPLTGAAIDRLGSRNVAIAGILGLIICTLLIAILPISQISLFGMAALIGVFASMSAVPTYSRGIATWFKRDLGLALGVALSGSALVAIFATPLTGNMIAVFGWRTGFLTIAGIMLTVGLPLIVYLYRESVTTSPSSAANVIPLSGAALGEALRDARFWFYLLSFTSACVALGGTLAHLQPLLAEKGVPLNEAISLGVVYALAMTFGKVVGGILLDRFWPFAVAAVITILAASGAAGLAVMDSYSSHLLVAIMTASIGLAQGAEADFVAFFILRSFGMRAFSAIVGFVAMVVTLGLTVGAWLFGALFDIFGNYEAASIIGAGFLATAGLLILTAGFCERQIAKRSVSFGFEAHAG